MNDAFLENITFASVTNSIWRQKYKSLLFAALMLGLVLVVLVLLPRKYESVGKLFIQVGRGGVTLDPTTTTSKTIMVQESRESEINSVVDVLQSRGVLQRVIAQENIEDEIVQSSFVLNNIKLPSLPSDSDSDADEEQERLLKIDRAIKALSGCLSVRAPRKASTITIACRTESPKLSQKIVRVLLATYIEQHVLARQTDGSYDFFEQEFAIQQTSVDAISKEIETYKNSIGVMSIEGRQASLREEIAEINIKLLDASAELSGYNSEVKALDDMTGNVPEQVELESTGGVANQASDLMKDRLFSLEIQERELLSRLKSDHPSVINVRKQVAEVKSILGKQKSSRTVTKTGLNKNRQLFDMLLMEARINQSSSDARVASLIGLRDEAMAKMTKMNEYETTLASMYRRLTVAESNFGIYSEKREEARINRELDLQNISNVKIVQQATIQAKHVSPRYGLVLIASALFALAGALCVGIFAEQIDSSVKTERQVESVLGVDVLASIPTLSRRNVYVG